MRLSSLLVRSFNDLVPAFNDIEEDEADLNDPVEVTVLDILLSKLDPNSYKE